MIHLLPDKHVAFSESLLGLGALVLTRLDTPKSLDDLWAELRVHPAVRERIDGTIGLETLSLATALLFCVGAVKLNHEGRIENETARTARQ